MASVDYLFMRLEEVDTNVDREYAVFMPVTPDQVNQWVDSARNLAKMGMRFGSLPAPAMVIRLPLDKMEECWITKDVYSFDSAGYDMRLIPASIEMRLIPSRAGWGECFTLYVSMFDRGEQLDLRTVCLNFQRLSDVIG